MKEALVLLLSLFAISSTGLTQLQDYSISRVNATLVASPQFGQRRGNPDDKWLAIEVEFKSNVEKTEELTLSYNMLYAKKYLAGETVYSNVFKGHELHSVMYVSPRSLKALSDTKFASLNPLDNITVQIINKGQPVAIKSYKEPIRPEWWKSLTPVKGGLLKKSETPFWFIDWDYYEEIKPEVR